ncbi:MAG: hypothetical protein D6722_29685 [Bacteroidetes bacterium]|nr:MAG: hypothetical protein D6722_29685 [Bacteroidota bacterium]
MLGLHLAYGQPEAAPPPDTTVDYIRGVMVTGDTSFWVIADMAEDYFARTHPDSVPPGFAKAYGRWYHFWRSRVDSAGDLHALNAKLVEIVNSGYLCQGAGDWSCIGPVIENSSRSGIITAVYAPPGQGAVPSTLYAGSNTGGLWKTVDGGLHWRCITDTLHMPALGINAISGHPTDTSQLLIATGYAHEFVQNYGLGVYRSDNGGESWQSTSLSWIPSLGEPMVRNLVRNTQQPDTVYAVGRRRDGGKKNLYVFRSIDDGVNWIELVRLDSVPLTTLDWREYPMELEVLPGQGVNQSDVIMVSTASIEIQAAKIFVSTDGGQSWANRTPAGYNSDLFLLAKTAADSGAVYAACLHIDSAGSPYHPLLKTADFGQSWQVLRADIPNSRLSRTRPVFEINQLNAQVMYFGGNSLMRTTNAGATASVVTDYYPPSGPNSTHADIRAMHYYSSSSDGGSDVILIGTDGGINMTTQGGLSNTWQNRNGTELLVTQVFDIGMSSQYPDFIGAGTQDNGFFSRLPGTTNWTSHTPIWGDGGQVVVGWQDPAVIYARSNDLIYRSSDGGASYSLFTSTEPPQEYEPYPFRQDPADAQSILVGRRKWVYRYGAGGSLLSSVQVAQFKPPDSTAKFKSISTLEIAEANPDVIYVASDARSTPGFILKSSDGGQTWQPTANSTLWNDKGTTCIAIDPQNSARIWVGLAGFGGIRILHSADGGLTWHDRSNGLPRVPVNDLIYLKGSQDVLYAANDIGVYQYDPVSAQWSCFSRGLPACLVSDLEIDYCQGLIRAGVYGRGVWESPLPAGPTWVITSDTTWAAETITHVYGSLVVAAGATLTIQGLVNMGLDASIRVEPHGRLIVDGGTLTNLCGGFWKGIDLAGSSTQDQLPLSWPTYQGKVELKNGATLAHARDGISTGIPQGSGMQPSGGLIVAEASTFLNNRRAVEFLTYDGFQNSRFLNCTFRVDDDYRGNGDFSSHLTLWDCHGVEVTTCTFQNAQSGRAYDPGLNNGIYGLDAGFVVRGHCAVSPPTGSPCPPKSLTSTLFEGFNRGVRASGGNNAYTVDIREAYLRRNGIGIYVSELDQAVLLRNRFEVGDTVPRPDSLHMGVWVQGSSGYRVEENTCTAGALSLHPTLGMRITESGTANNEVYKNTFSELWAGIRAEGLNRSPINAYEGLVIACNQFSRMQWLDIDIQAIGGNSQHGVRMHQGDQSGGLAAGNIFTHSGNHAESDYRNATDWGIFYYHHGGTSAPLYYTSGRVAPMLLQDVPDCPSRVDIGIGGAPQQLLQQYDSAEQALQSLAYAYQQFIDGGNTPALVSQIQGSWSQDAWNLRSELLARSPSLSEKALRQAALQGIMPDAMLLEVCLANPEVLRNEAFLQFLETDLVPPMPSYMVNLLAAYWDSTTLRTGFERGLAHFSGLRTQAADALLTHLRLDSLDQTPTLSHWLTRRGSLSDRYGQVALHLARRQADSALMVLDTLAGWPEMSYPALAQEQQDYRDYLQLCQSVFVANRDLMHLTATELATLEQIALRPYSRAVGMARNLLCFGYEMCLDETTGTVTSLSRRPRPDLDPQALIHSHYYQVWAFPNPAQDYATVAWQFVHLSGPASLTLYDGLGRPLAQTTITTPEGQWLWDTRTLPTGLYTYVLRDADQTILGQGKLTLSPDKPISHPSAAGSTRCGANA